MKIAAHRSPVVGRARARLLLAAAVSLVLAAGAGSLPPALGGAARASAVRESQGYWLLGADGGVFTFGDATYYGPNRNVGADIAAMARTPDGGGFWTVDDDGDVFHYGNAVNYGSRLLDVDDITGFAARPRGDGYWMATRTGVVSAFGAAPHQGPAVALQLNRPVVDMAATPSGLGYWLVASDGGIFSFGDAAFFGSTGGDTLNQPIVGIAPTPSGLGYWLVASDGGIFSFGDAAFFGSTGGATLNQPIVGMASTGTGLGYWLVASDGGVFTFGDAAFHGSTGAVTLNQPIRAMVATPVRLLNTLPAAASDSAAVDEDASVTVDVLANDSGLGDGGLAVSITSPPLHGSAGVGAGGNVSYTPAPDYSGPDTLTYRVVDIDGDASTATLNLTVTPGNDAPTAADQSRSTSEETVLGGSVGAIDIDGDTLAYSVTGAAAHGVASVDAAGAFTYTPAVDFNGADSFTITVVDGRGGSDTAVVTVTVGPLTDPPTISALADRATDEDTPTSAPGLHHRRRRHPPGFPHGQRRIIGPIRRGQRRDHLRRGRRPPHRHRHPGGRCQRHGHHHGGRLRRRSGRHRDVRPHRQRHRRRPDDHRDRRPLHPAEHAHRRPDLHPRRHRHRHGIPDGERRFVGRIRGGQHRDRLRRGRRRPDRHGYPRHRRHRHDHHHGDRLGWDNERGRGLRPHGQLGQVQEMTTLNPPPDGDETPGGLAGGVTRLPLDESPEGAEAIESLEDSIERLRGRRDGPSPAPEPKAPPARLPRQPLWVVMAVVVVLLGAWGANDVAKRANRTSVRYDAVVLEDKAAAAATRPSVPSTAATTTTTPVAPPAAVPVEVTTTTATTTTTTTKPPTTTTTKPPTTTTTAAPAQPRPVPASSSTTVVSGVRLTLSASPPASGEPRTAGFRIESEFGDVRVMRSLRIEFGDGTSLDASVVQWSCLDPAAPNPYVFVSPAHVYADPGTYTVTATVRTAPCSLPDGSELPEEWAQVRLSLPVP